MQATGLICEGPRCTKGANGIRMSVNWLPELVKNNPTQMPDAYCRFIITQSAYEEPQQGPNGQFQEIQPLSKHFCSASCLRDFYGKDYVPPRSPREIMETLENNKKVEAEREKDLQARAAKRDGTNLIEFPKPLTEEEKQAAFDEEEAKRQEVPAVAPETIPEPEPDGVA